MRLEADKTFWMPRGCELFSARYGLVRGNDYDIVTAILHQLDFALPNDKIPRFDIERCLMGFDKVQGKCVGFLTHSQSAGRKVFVDWIGVLPSYQRKRWGTFLLATLLWRLHKASVDDVQAIFPTHLIPMFISLGFRLTENQTGAERFGFNRITTTLVRVFDIPQELLLLQE